MRVGILGPITWRTPPRHYGPWERFVSLLTEGLVARGVDVTLFATADSLTSAKLVAVCPRPYEEDSSLDPRTWELLHIANAFERAREFDILHNSLDIIPLSHTGLVQTPVIMTIHGFASPKVLPIYEKYNRRVHYVAISNASRRPELSYSATIYHGIPVQEYTCTAAHGSYLLFFGRIHPDKGTKEAIEVARRFGMKLRIAGIIHDQAHFDAHVAPALKDGSVEYLGSVGPEQHSALLGGAYALLHMTVIPEPFGFSLVEALACGTPVVARPLGSIPEIIDDGVTGFHVDTVEDAVRALGKIPTLDRAACRRVVEERFTVERMVSDYLQVYARILGGDPRA